MIQRDVLVHGVTIHLHAIPGFLVLIVVFYFCFTVAKALLTVDI